jgi:hypothetical protein
VRALSSSAQREPVAEVRAVASGFEVRRPGFPHASPRGIAEPRPGGTPVSLESRPAAGRVAGPAFLASGGVIAALLARVVVQCVSVALVSTAALMLWPLPSTPPGAPAAPSAEPPSDGGCSSPFGGTRWGFAAACDLHDARYDVLRRAAATGAPRAPAVRRAADAAFIEQLRARCDTRDGWDAVGCRLTARLYAGAVAANSWRQHYGPPGHEPALPWLAGSGVAVVLATSIGLRLVAHADTQAALRPAREPAVGKAA